MHKVLEALTALAFALRTSVGYLLGGGYGLPPGHAVAVGTQPSLEEMTPQECWAKLSAGGVGRVVFSTETGPGAVPVNFTVQNDTVVYRTAPDSVLADVAGQKVAFEVDRVDDALTQGWSVLVTGTAKQIPAGETLRNPGEQADPHPWPTGRRDVWMRVTSSGITGRALREAGNRRRCSTLSRWECGIDRASPGCGARRIRRQL
ncbi:pyridoxamine 5'-phosphate oxidase family protein [Streptomyces netropsis]|uniref:pyridoxamine 5'-phosphate oxidase family protein n=1 Tax=Streptomyces netropsis TaxID=55404 RepID=UPI0037BDE676